MLWFVHKLQELNKFMYTDDWMRMLKFNQRLDQAKRYVECCAKVYQHQIDNGPLSRSALNVFGS